MFKAKIKGDREEERPLTSYNEKNTKDIV